jgi:hypothetical protein
MTEATLRLRFSLVTLAEIARDLARGGYRDGVGWRGVVRQIRVCAAELRTARERRTDREGARA